MYKTFEKLIQQFGVKILALPLIFIIVLIAFTHIMSGDGSKISVLYGLVEYTKSVDATKNSLKTVGAIKPIATIKVSKKTTVSEVANKKNLPHKAKFKKLYINPVYPEGYEKFTIGVDVRNYLHNKKYSFQKGRGWISLDKIEHKYIRYFAIYFNEETLVGEKAIYWLHDKYVKEVLDLSITKLGYKRLTKNKLETVYEWKNISGFNIAIDLIDNNLSITKFLKP